MKAYLHLFLLATAVGWFLLSLTGCETAIYQSPSATPRIDADHQILTFSVAYGDGDVVFTHAQHAGYYQNSCLVCHSHTHVRDDSIWGCGFCHTSEDSEGICEDDLDGHDCLQVQCADCHAQQTPNPTPVGLCFSCH